MHKQIEKKVSQVPSNRPFKDLKKEITLPVSKKNLLVAFGVGDIFCDKNSPRFLKAGEKILNDTRNLVKENKRRYSGYVAVHEYNDTIINADPFKDIKQAKIVDLSLYVPQVFSPQNVLKVTQSSGDPLDPIAALQASNFDFLLPPSQYNLFMCGIDINGAFMGTIDKLIEWGYFVTVYSDIIKPYSKDTIDYLISTSKDRDNHLRFGKS